MLDRNDSQSLTPVDSTSSSYTASDLTHVNSDNRLSSQFGPKIGNAHVYETKEQHEKNVEALVSDIQRKIKAAKEDNSGYSPDQVEHIMALDLRTKHARGEISDDTYVETQYRLGKKIRLGNMIATPLEQLLDEHTQSKEPGILAPIRKPEDVQLSREQSEDLLVATLKKDPDNIKALLKANAKFNELNEHGYPPLFYALFDLNLLQAFIENGVPVDYKYGPEKLTALHYALTSSTDEKIVPAECIKYLVEKGADTNLMTPQPNTKYKMPAFHHCVFWRPELIEFFLEHGAHINLRGEQKLHALDVATISSDLKAFETLLKHNATFDLDIKSDTIRRNHANTGTPSNPDAFISLLEKYDAKKTTLKKTLYFYRYYITALAVLAFLVFYNRKALYDKFQEFVSFRDTQAHLANLKALTTGLDASWTKVKNNQYRLTLNQASNKIHLDVLKKHLKEKCGSVVMEENAITVMYTAPLESSDTFYGYAQKLLQEVAQQQKAIESIDHFAPIKKRLDKLSIQELKDAETEAENKVKARIQELKTERKNKQANNPKETKILEESDAAIKRLDEQKKPAINYSDLEKELAEIKNSPLTDLAKFSTQVSVMEAVINNANKQIREYAASILSSCSKVDSALANLTADKKLKRRDTEKPEVKETTTPVVQAVAVAPPPAPVAVAVAAPQPVVTSAPAKKPAAPSSLTLFPLPKVEAKKPAPLHTDPVFQYTNNLRALVNELVREKALTAEDQEVYLHGIAYNILRIMQCMSDATDDRNVKMMRNLLAHTVAVQVGQ